MASFEAKLTSKGQITLPVQLRNRLRVDAGDKVIFTETRDGGYQLRARTGSMADLKGIVRAGSAVSGKDIERWIAEARGARAGRVDLPEKRTRRR